MEELIPIVLFISAAAVAILRPLTSRFGKLLEAMAREKTAAIKTGAGADESDAARLRVLVEHIGRRLDLIEERLDFTERLLASSRPGSLSGLRPEPFRRERETDLLTG